MGDQYVLQAVYALYFCCFWVNPVNLIGNIQISKDSLVFWAEKVAQIDAPVTVVLTPPIEIDVISCMYARFDQTHALIGSSDPSLILIEFRFADTIVQVSHMGEDRT